ncbi:RES family NAD+ phosphorylase [Microcella flavibacter]|uniref:RES family NAD+ phosphorylase n=1 Tax=Microcella flavibacter TaxID=1804990 RepID=UPI0014578B7E|nr:RES family NAD+ phosphorylase [Microcella flavibacter]
MLFYRVFIHDAGAAPGKPGHAQYLHRPQTKGRWDNPSLYESWYLSTSPEGAIGETFGNLDYWTKDMFTRPYMPSGRMALGVFEIPDDLAVCDLDNPRNLDHYGMRASEVVKRNLPYTQEKAREIFSDGRWAGIGWWSYHRPIWSNRLIWGTTAAPAPMTLVDVERLELSHRALISARESLAKQIR